MLHICLQYLEERSILNIQYIVNNLEKKSWLGRLGPHSARILGPLVALHGSMRAPVHAARDRLGPVRVGAH